MERAPSRLGLDPGHPEFMTGVRGRIFLNPTGADVQRCSKYRWVVFDGLRRKDVLDLTGLLALW